MSGRRLLAVAAGAVLVLVFRPSVVSGTVEEQRARLPPPAECGDPIEGVWMALKYTPRFRDWNEVTLNIRRARLGEEALAGPISAHMWMGGPDDSSPPECRSGANEQIIKMPGTGALNGVRVEFGSTSYDVDKIVCGSHRRYNPDHFSGTMDFERQEFQSVNNDGGRSVNEPVVFRRIRCFDPPRKAPAANLSVPAFGPAKRGCSR